MFFVTDSKDARSFPANEQIAHSRRMSDRNIFAGRHNFRDSCCRYERNSEEKTNVKKKTIKNEIDKRLLFLGVIDMILVSIVAIEFLVRFDLSCT